jgi:hypothetical protein
MSDTGSSGIACIGWGSLVYDWRDLPCGAWHNDGPMLPVEFARESGVKPGLRGTRITLVICPDVERVQTCWSLLDVEDLSAARVSLARREDVVNNMERDIGYWDRKTGKLHGLEAEAIGQWASARGLAAAVWTSLGFGFKGNRGVMGRRDRQSSSFCASSMPRSGLPPKTMCDAPPRRSTRRTAA